LLTSAGGNIGPLPDRTFAEWAFAGRTWPHTSAASLTLRCNRRDFGAIPAALGDDGRILRHGIEIERRKRKHHMNTGGAVSLLQWSELRLIAEKAAVLRLALDCAVQVGAGPGLGFPGADQHSSDRCCGLQQFPAFAAGRSPSCGRQAHREWLLIHHGGALNASTANKPYRCTRKAQRWAPPAFVAARAALVHLETSRGLFLG
jgi:hypothetical protein